jgi:hypothetical protein
MKAPFSRLHWATVRGSALVYYSDLVAWLLCTNIEYLIGSQRILDAELKAITINYIMKISTGTTGDITSCA